MKEEKLARHAMSDTMTLDEKGSKMKRIKPRSTKADLRFRKGRRAKIRWSESGSSDHGRIELREKTGGTVECITLRELSQRKKTVDNEAKPTLDRSRLNQLINEKETLLEELLCCTEELADLYKHYSFMKQQREEIRKLCIICELRYGGSHSRTLDMLHTTARLFAEQRKFEEAAALLDKLYPLRLKVDGRTAEKTLKCYALRAVVFEELGEHLRAQRALAELRVFGSENMPDLLRITSEECKSIYDGRRSNKKS